MKPRFLLLLFIICSSLSAFAQPQQDTGKAPVRFSRSYIGTSLDGLIFSTALIDQNNSTTAGTLRFTAFLNIGITFNLDFGDNFGGYTGIDIKNVGFIMDDPVAGGTAKYRTYNVGVPVGIKIGNMSPGRHYIFLGGGVDFPVNYKEKHFAIRDQKTKFTEWFSARNAAIMPYVFVGVSVFRALTVKIQYYPTNFFNPDFTNNSVKPYDNINVNLLLFSLGTSLPLYRKKDIVKQQVSSLNAY